MENRQIKRQDFGIGLQINMIYLLRKRKVKSTS